MVGGSVVRSAHFYRKVPRELTEGTTVGGLISLAAILVSITLVSVITSAFLETSYRTQLELDVRTEEFIDLAFNVTLERLPCRFTSVDSFDETGTKRLNITQDLVKVRISSADGHALAAEDEEFWYDEVDTGEPEHHTLEELLSETGELNLPEMRALSSESEFAEFISHKQLVLVAFGAFWCPWSKKLEPTWQRLGVAVSTDPLLDEFAAIAKVDCTIKASQPLCKAQGINAFPTVRVYRAHNSHSHEEYHGDRTFEAMIDFIQESIEMGLPEEEAFHPLTHLTHISGEGCQIWGKVRISRVPGNLRISAQSSVHSFNPLLMNVTHHVDALVFLSPTAELDYRLQAAALAAGGESAAMTLKHYLKVVPTRRVDASGNGVDTYEYSTNYNEFLPRNSLPSSHEEHQRLVPNTAFSYDISPYRVVHRQSASSWGELATQLCAVVGGVFTVFGLLDGMLYTGMKAIKRD